MDNNRKQEAPSLVAKIFHSIKRLPILRVFYRNFLCKRKVDERRKLALTYFESRLKNIDRWLSDSRETTNFTYDLEELNLKYLASVLSVVTGQDESVISGYISEILNDNSFKEHVRSMTERAPIAMKSEADADARIARRAGWYAVVRAVKPKTVVETGIDKGLGSCVLCTALMRNAEEGVDGHYYGTDINPNAGWLLGYPYSEYGTILYGDSLESMRALNKDIDVFINDSDHSKDYERAEYEAVIKKLGNGALILGDNAHCNSELHDFSVRNGRKFLYWQEWPKEHWYPGCGIGFSYRHY